MRVLHEFQAADCKTGRKEERKEGRKKKEIKKFIGQKSTNEQNQNNTTHILCMVIFNRLPERPTHIDACRL
jgi:hypothetical protein